MHKITYYVTDAGVKVVSLELCKSKVMINDFFVYKGQRLSFVFNEHNVHHAIKFF